MPASPLELSLEIRPTSRFDIVNVRQQAEGAADLAEYPHHLYCSFHTTAGFLEQSLVSRLNNGPGGIGPYMRVFQTMFPRGAGYRHDDLHLRQELSDAQRHVEPRNADAHLAFIAAGLRTCVKYVNRPGEPVYFVDLDGLDGDRQRRRTARILGFEREEVVARDRLHVPMSSHPLDSVSLKDPRIGLYAGLDDLIARHGVTKGRIRLFLGAGEDQAALTINEYETLLMRHDLVDVIRDPFRFMAEKGRNLIADPWAIPAKAIDYAKYDFVRLFNQICDLFHISESRVEDLAARLIGLPARRFLRMKRSVSLLVSDQDSPGRGRIVEGAYQCPILVQWRKAHADQRVVGITLARLE
ncbi:MAG: hypothetical protein LC791_13725 [Acidobacteria bacterium]|nr:hypothetical protein [Acidobacteriota bacterium]